MPEEIRSGIVLTRQQLGERFPFFGPRSLFVDSVVIEQNPDGSPGTKAIGTWRVPSFLTTDHFRDFTVTNATGREVNVEGLRVLPGHKWPEPLGQVLCALATVRHPDAFVDVLPVYRHIDALDFELAAFAGQTVNLCVEMEHEIEERGGLRVIGRGASIFNEQRLALVGGMQATVTDLERTMRMLKMLRARYERQERIPASFANFDQYLAPTVVKT